MKALLVLALTACGFEGPPVSTWDASVGSSPSCVNLAPTCGPAGNDDCCSTATPIPGGAFFRSYDVAADGMYPDKSFPATVSPFLLDKYEVTVGRFRKFVEAGGGTQQHPPMPGDGVHEKIAGSGWDPSWDASLTTSTMALEAAVKCDPTQQSWTDVAGGNEVLPINCVTWYEAMAFCAGDGAFLPTESEWNYAAAGGNEQRAYPWSSPPGETTIDCSYANYSACASGLKAVGHESPKGDGKWGQADLGGNVFEWTLDWHASPYPTTTCDDCADLTVATYIAIRGGGLNVDATALRTAYRDDHDAPPTKRYASVGFRCARM